MKSLVFFVAFIPLLLLVLYAAVRDIVGTSSHNGCRMTYMYPGYEQVPVVSRLSKYSLFVYQEGYGRKSSQVEVPVLFIPGNAGAYKQARSMGTLGNAYATDQFGLRVFTVDSIDELAAFDSALIHEQALFVNDAIRTILDSYSGNSYYKPTSVILVAHSMGGIVAKSLFTLPNYVNGSVNSIITLATPHSYPPVAIEKSMVSLYNTLNQNWKHQLNPSNPLKKSQNKDFDSLMVVSIAGGERDAMIQSKFCELGQIVPPDHGFTIYSTAVKDVWVSADHRCILWCNQLTHSLVRGLYGMIDSRNPTKPIELRERVKGWRNLLEYDFGKKSRILNEGNAQTPTNSAQFKLVKSSRLVLTANEFLPSTYHVFPLSNNYIQSVLNVYAFATTFEMYACPSNNPDATTFNQCVSISHLLDQLPKSTPSKNDESVDETIQVLVINRTELEGFDSIVVSVSQYSDKKGVFGVEESNHALVEVKDSWIDGQTIFVPIRSISNIVLFRKITESIFSYNLEIKPVCSMNDGRTRLATPQSQPVLFLNVTGTSESKLLFPWPRESIPITFHKDSTVGLEMRLFADPVDLGACGGAGREQDGEFGYEIKVGLNLVSSLGTIARRNVNLLIVFCGALCLSVLLYSVLVRDGSSSAVILPRVFAWGSVGVLLRLIVVIFWTDESLTSLAISSLVMYPIAYVLVFLVNYVLIGLELIWGALVRVLPTQIRHWLTKPLGFAVLSVLSTAPLGVLGSTSTTSTTLFLVTLSTHAVIKSLSSTQKPVLLALIHSTLLAQLLGVLLSAPRMIVWVKDVLVHWTRDVSVSSPLEVWGFDVFSAVLAVAWVILLLTNCKENKSGGDSAVRNVVPARYLVTVIATGMTIIISVCEGADRTWMLGNCLVVVFGVGCLVVAFSPQVNRMESKKDQ